MRAGAAAPAGGRGTSLKSLLLSQLALFWNFGILDFAKLRRSA